MSEVLTVRDVAAVMKMSEDAVTRIFGKLPGVIDLGRAETRNRRRYRVLRIPTTVLEKYLTAKAGHPVRVDVPDRPERRRKSDKWETRAIMNLARQPFKMGTKASRTGKFLNELPQTPGA